MLMSEAGPGVDRRTDHKLTILAICLVTIAVMGVLSFAAPPLYDAFARATGQNAMALSSANTRGVIARKMRVRFDTTVSHGLPVSIITPATLSGRIGEQQTAAYMVTNTGPLPISVRATFNVLPDLAGSYFKATKCFCTKVHTLAPGETAKWPVTFFVDPELDKDRTLKTVSEMTLSYTFFAADNGGS